MAIARGGRDRLIRSLTRVGKRAAPVAQPESRFTALVREADAARDAHDWDTAEGLYGTALALDPGQDGYWVQHGHMLKEQGRDAEAECSYRTACALGSNTADTLEHLRFVLDRQGVSERQFPIRSHGDAVATARQAPTRPAIEALARLAWQTSGVGTEDLLDLMRSESLDHAFARMIADQRFERANWAWLDVVRDGDL